MCLGLFTSSKGTAAVVRCCFQPVSSVSLLLISRRLLVLTEMVLEQRSAIPREDAGHAKRSESRERCFHADSFSVVTQLDGHCSFLLHSDGFSYSIRLLIGSRNNQSSLDISIHVHIRHTSIFLSLDYPSSNEEIFQLIHESQTILFDISSHRSSS